MSMVRVEIGTGSKRSWRGRNFAAFKIDKDYRDNLRGCDLRIQLSYEQARALVCDLFRYLPPKERPLMTGFIP